MIEIKEVMLSKPNKLNYMNIKVYRVISQLNYLGRVYKMVVADMLAEW